MHQLGRAGRQVSASLRTRGPAARPAGRSLGGESARHSAVTLKLLSRPRGALKSPTGVQLLRGALGASVLSRNRSSGFGVQAWG